MDISIVIRCGDDPRVYECINSIDEDVDIIVSTSENAEFEKGLKEKGIRYCLSPRKNLSKTSNIGIEHAKYGKVIITDSDTVFDKGCIKKIHSALCDHKIVRAKLSFKESSDIILSKVVASARDFVNSKELAFTPGLAIKKEVAEQLGGFIFNDEVPFAVDADLNYRIRKNGVDVCFLNDAVIYHAAESVRHDLIAAKRIGNGVAISSISLSKRAMTDDTVRAMRRSMKAVKFSDYIQILKQKGVPTLIYQIIWDIHFLIGSHSRLIREV